MDGSRGGRWLVGVAVAEAVLVGLVAFALWGGERVEAGLAASEAAGGAGSGVAAGGVGSEEATGASGSGTQAVGSRSEAVEVDAPAVSVGAVERAVVFGRISSKGKAVTSAMVTVTVAGETKPIGTMRADDGGSYAVPALAPGRYSLRFMKDGFRARGESVEVPVGVDRVRLDVALTPNWELRVLMVDADGRPLNEALGELRKAHPGLWRASPHALATLEPPPALLPSTENALPEVGMGEWRENEGPMAGGLRLPRRYSGYLALAEDVPLYVSAALRTVVLATERVEAGQEEVVLRVEMAKVVGSFGTVRVQVVDGVGGGPMQGARVGLNDAQSSGQGELVDAEGRVELKMQRPGLLNVDVSAKGLVAGWWNVEVVPGGTVDLGVLAVVAPVKFSARFEGVGKDAEVWCSLRLLDPPPSVGLRARSLRLSGRKGGTVEYGIAPGRYELRATGGGGVGVVEFDSRELGGEAVVVRMVAAAKLRVVPGEGGVAVGLTLKDEWGRVVFGRWLTGRGAFELGLPVGVYGAEVRRLGGEMEERVVRLGAEGGELVLR